MLFLIGRLPPEGYAGELIAAELDKCPFCCDRVATHTFGSGGLLVWQGPAWSSSGCHRGPSNQPGNPRQGFWFSLSHGHHRRSSGTTLGCGSFLILDATQMLTPYLGIVKAAQMAGLFYVLRNIVQVATSYPVGAMADRYGSIPVLVVGYVLGTLTAILTMPAFWLSVDSIVYLGGIFFIAGLYMAIQEALEASVTADLVSPGTLGTSYGALVLFTNCFKGHSPPVSRHFPAFVAARDSPGDDATCRNHKIPDMLWP